MQGLLLHIVQDEREGVEIMVSNTVVNPHGWASSYDKAAKSGCNLHPLCLECTAPGGCAKHEQPYRQRQAVSSLATWQSKKERGVV